MNLIKTNKGIRSGRKNQILLETIKFQERLFERLKCPDFPLLEKLKMVKIIKGNIEEFCYLKLQKASTPALYSILQRIEDLYGEINEYFMIRIREEMPRNCYMNTILDEIEYRKIDPIVIRFRSNVDDTSKSIVSNSTSIVFTCNGGNDDLKTTDDEILRIKVLTPKLILRIDEYLTKIEESYAENTIKSLSFEKFEGRDNYTPEELENFFTFSNDMIFRTPYDSYNIILKFIKGRLESPKVHTILMTLYRTAIDSKIVDMICEYSERYVNGSMGKRIFVYVETTASGNEDLNKENIKRLSKAGVYVIYGSEYKVHAKMFIAIGMHDMWAHFSTGNYNEKSAGAYTDIQLITKDRMKIVPAMTTFYEFIWGRASVSHNLSSTNCIWFSPTTLKSTLIGLFREQIKLKDKGLIEIKVNSIADDEIMNYIYEAIENDVKVHIICRSICLIDPTYLQKPNVIVESYCGRFLEHDRIYGFGGRYFIASADLSFRNMHKRVESFIEMTDPSCVRFLREVIESMPIENPYKFVMDFNGKWNLVQTGNYKNE